MIKFAFTSWSPLENHIDANSLYRERRHHVIRLPRSGDTLVVEVNIRIGYQQDGFVIIREVRSPQPGTLHDHFLFVATHLIKGLLSGAKIKARIACYELMANGNLNRAELNYLPDIHHLELIRWIRVESEEQREISDWLEIS